MIHQCRHLNSSRSVQTVTELVYAKVLDTYKRKVESIAQQAYPVLKDVYTRMSHVYENVVVPITDGVRVFQVITNLKATAESEAGNW